MVQVTRIKEYTFYSNDFITIFVMLPYINNKFSETVSDVFRIGFPNFYTIFVNGVNGN